MLRAEASYEGQEDAVCLGCIGTALSSSSSEPAPARHYSEICYVVTSPPLLLLRTV